MQAFAMSYVSRILGFAILICSAAAAGAQDSTTEGSHRHVLGRWPRLRICTVYRHVGDSGQATDEVRAFFVAISNDAGDSWKFVDGEAISPANLEKIIPSYRGQALPIVNFQSSPLNPP
jgi:hypothetical protein